MLAVKQRYVFIVLYCSCAVSIVRLELRQQLEQLKAANEATKSSNAPPSDDLALVSQTVEHVSLIHS